MGRSWCHVVFNLTYSFHRVMNLFNRFNILVLCMWIKTSTIQYSLLFASNANVLHVHVVLACFLYFSLVPWGNIFHLDATMQ